MFQVLVLCQHNMVVQSTAITKTKFSVVMFLLLFMVSFALPLLGGCLETSQHKKNASFTLRVVILCENFV